MVKASPTVHAAGDGTARSNNWADRGHNVVMVMFSEAVHQQTLILCQFPQFQSTCKVAVGVQRETKISGLEMCWSLLWNLQFTRVRCHDNTFVRYPFGIHNSSLSLHPSFAELLVGGFGRVAVDPERPLPAPTTEAGGTKQQSSICTEAQEKLWHVWLSCRQQPFI